MPNRAIEIHDSILADVSFSQGEAQLHFSKVYIHQSESAPGRAAGSVWVQEAILRISSATVEGVFSELPVNLDGGQIQVGQNLLKNEIPVPLRHKGAFLEAWQWQQSNGVIIFTGSGAELELLGEPKYVEEFWP